MPTKMSATEEMNYFILIAGELGVETEQVQAVAALLAEDATVPFIARYRKEATGSLDEVQITIVRDRLEQLREIAKRREAILKSLTERNLLTGELKAAILAAQTLALLEDLYLPYRPKRRTRATIAAEKGLTPLADTLFLQNASDDPQKLALAYLDQEKGVATVEDALAGARDILAERISETAEIRSEVRGFFRKEGIINAQVIAGKEEAGAKFRDYFDWSEPVSRAGSHRILAMLRGEAEEALKIAIRPPQLQALNLVYRQVLHADNAAAQQIREAVDDGYQRLLAPGIETEIRNELKARADEEAIAVFVQNVRELLLAPSLGQKRILALDPGFRTGCKLVILDAQGRLLEDTVVYPTQSEHRKQEAAQMVQSLCKKYAVEAIAIGNGTASRETESFVRALNLSGVTVVMVNESGASVYSASEVARGEFPDKDVTVRGAVSIGRRLMDPLSELVKIDPKAIGVGQYQHDVDQSALKKSLDDTVISCVNAVGVEVNTAGRQLLAYVSGLGAKLADNIVSYRDENGPFAKRSDLKKVPRLGPKAFEQCAGFLRIRGGDNPLDASAVHPESYDLVKRMAADLGCNVNDLLKSAELRAKINCNKYVDGKIGLPTIHDILQELAKPGRDPREKFEAFSFAEGIHALDDLKPGMNLPGIVTNVTQFGAFVDIGVHQDGLVHISELADHFVKVPADVVKVQQKVKVTVIEVDKERNRIALSMRSNSDLARSERGPKQEHAPRDNSRQKSQTRPGAARKEDIKQPDRTSPNWLLNALKK